MEKKHSKLVCDVSNYAGSPASVKEESGNGGRVRQRDRVWSIVLAGGNGERISADIHRWMGRAIPKQYCAFVGTRSMLQHTIARADALSVKEHQLTVVAKSHLCEVDAQLANQTHGTIIVQPKNCDTLAGVFLPLTYAYARDPEATVVIFPSDHFIYPEKAFLEIIDNAVQAAEELPGRLVLIGVQAESIDQDYGWIQPGARLWHSEGCGVHAVQLFLEKPLRADAAAMKASGGLWNTMIITAKARALWQLGWERFPEMLVFFEKLRNAIGTVREHSVLETIYEAMPAKNFSADLIAQATDQIVVMPTEGIIWSDWGRIERIIETLFRVGRRPNFPMIPTAQHIYQSNSADAQAL
jgi:mannose-1-phosphate guanylyltransferase